MWTSGTTTCGIWSTGASGTGGNRYFTFEFDVLFNGTHRRHKFAEDSLWDALKDNNAIGGKIDREISQYLIPGQTVYAWIKDLYKVREVVYIESKGDKKMKEEEMKMKGHKGMSPLDVQNPGGDNPGKRGVEIHRALVKTMVTRATTASLYVNTYREDGCRDRCTFEICERSAGSDADIPVMVTTGIETAVEAWGAEMGMLKADAEIDDMVFVGSSATKKSESEKDEGEAE